MLCVVIPKDWQVFLVMDLLLSVDPLMGGVFQNSHGGVGRSCLAEQSAYQLACVGVCVGFLDVNFQGLPECLNNLTNPMEESDFLPL